MSSATSVRDALEGYIAGQVPAERVVAVVAAEYYRADTGMRKAIKPVMDVIERAHPGFVELSASSGTPGFQIKLAERPFPKRYEAELQTAVREVLLVLRPNQIKRIADPGPPSGSLWKRLLRGVRRLFTAST